MSTRTAGTADSFRHTCCGESLLDTQPTHTSGHVKAATGADFGHLEIGTIKPFHSMPTGLPNPPVLPRPIALFIARSACPSSHPAIMLSPHGSEEQAPSPRGPSPCADRTGSRGAEAAA